jgi:predicted dehydrogenase
VSRKIDTFLQQGSSFAFSRLAALDLEMLQYGQIMANKVGVGIIGASVQSWAAAAHVPAIQGSEEFELRAIATTRRDSAESAGRAFGVASWFADYRDLLSHPEIDLVVVAVKVPEHRELVAAAIETGKMVLCEWPLSVGQDAAGDLADRAKAAGVRTAIGLQARFAPAIQYARELVTQGHIGNVLGTTCVGSAALWGPETSRGQLYAFDAANGATALTTTTIHALDAIAFVLGEFTSVSAKLATARKTVRVTEDGTERPVNTPDQIAIAATLPSGSIASVFYRGGLSRGENLRWEINGTRGDLVFTSPVGNVQVAELKLEGGFDKETSLHEIDVLGKASEVSSGIGANVGRLYASLARDIRNGTNVVPDFAHAVRRHRLIAAIEAAAKSGVAQAL